MGNPSYVLSRQSSLKRACLAKGKLHKNDKERCVGQRNIVKGDNFITRMKRKKCLKTLGRM